MKFWLALMLCVCLTVCILVSCEESDGEVYVSPSEEVDVSESLTSDTSDTESDTHGESETKKTEQTMGAIQELVPVD